MVVFDIENMPHVCRRLVYLKGGVGRTPREGRFRGLIRSISISSFSAAGKEACWYKNMCRLNEDVRVEDEHFPLILKRVLSRLQSLN